MVNTAIYLGSLNKLNDPFEGEFLLDQSTDLPVSEDVYSFYRNFLKCVDADSKVATALENKRIFFEDARNYICDIIKTSFGSCSLTEKRSCNLMWSHYADSHRGFVLIIDKPELEQSIAELKHTPKIHLKK